MLNHHLRPIFFFLSLTLFSPWLVAEEAVPILETEVVNSFPHDPRAFTQGLVIADGELFESTGRNGASSLRRVGLEAGEILQRHNLEQRYFAEGITVLDERIYQLTWRANALFVYDRDNFTLLDSYYLPGEGWGLTDDGERLIVSDGTEVLRFLDPSSGKETGRVSVSYRGEALRNLNELEYINGEVWANVWYQDAIVRIDPETGQVNSVLNLSGLNPVPENREAVLNGIAWDKDNERLFVTGKLWPKLYEIRVLE